MYIKLTMTTLMSHFIRFILRPYAAYNTTFSAFNRLFKIWSININIQIFDKYLETLLLLDCFRVMI